MAIKIDTTKFARTLVNKDKFTPHLERAIAEGEFPWEYKFDGKKSDDAWHPSGDCTPSIFDLYWKAKGESEERSTPASLYKTFQVGHFWHQYLQFITVEKLGFADWDDIERHATKVWGWQEVMGHNSPDTPKPYHWVSGSADVCPCRIPVHGEYLVDFKTMKSQDFKQPGLPEWSADKYECQANIYMDLFDIDQALIVCILKDSPHDFKEFEYRRNQELIDAIYEKWHIVSDCLDQDVAPPVDIEIELPLTGPIKR